MHAAGLPSGRHGSCDVVACRSVRLRRRGGPVADPWLRFQGACCGGSYGRRSQGGQGMVSFGPGCRASSLRMPAYVLGLPQAGVSLQEIVSMSRTMALFD